MRTAYIPFCLLIIGFFSCSKGPIDSVQSNNFPKVDSILGQYLLNKEVHSSLYSMNVGSSGYGYFKYDDKNVSKRIGGYIQIYFPVYSDAIYDTVQYISSDTILLTTLDNTPDFNIYPDNRKIILGNGLIRMKITYNTFLQYYNLPGPQPVDQDTIYYSYDTKNRLSRTVQHLPNKIVERDYLYDNHDNLLKIMSTIKDSYPSLYITTATEEFGGYDNKKNPLKGICLWQDLLYRTLSANNFTTYLYREGNSSSVEYKTWTLVYNSQGEVDFSK